jgi:Short C-terminal domain
MYRRAMVLLNQYIRRAAITGRTDTIDPSWFAGRQGGRWVEQTVRSAMPPADRAEKLRELTELHERGVLTQAEFDALRARLRV